MSTLDPSRENSFRELLKAATPHYRAVYTSNARFAPVWSVLCSKRKNLEISQEGYMGKNSRWLFLLLIIVAFTCDACAAGQQAQVLPQEGVQAPPQNTMVFQGSLVQVNTDTKTLTVKNADNKEMQFIY